MMLMNLLYIVFITTDLFWFNVQVNCNISYYFAMYFTLYHGKVKYIAKYVQKME